MDLRELLTEAERADLEQAVRRASRIPVQREAPAVEETLVGVGQVYIDARLAGLCHEGALELFEDALRVRA